MDMGIFLCILTILLWGTALTEGNGCANFPSNQPKGQVINICEANTRTVSGYFYLSGSSAEMGNMTRCNCSILALTQEASLSVIGSAVIAPQFTQCNATWHIRGSTEETFTCLTSYNFYIDMNASIVTVDVVRQVLDDFDFCIFMARRDFQLGNGYNVTCENNADQLLSSETPVTLTTASLTPRSSTLTSTPAPPVTSQDSTSRDSSASVSKSSFTDQPPSSSTTDSRIPPASTSMTGCSERAEACPCQCSVCVAMAAVGWIMAAVLSAALVLVCFRLRKAASTRSPGGGADNSAYAHLSELTRTDLRADPNYSVIGSSVTPQ